MTAAVPQRPHSAKSATSESATGLSSGDGGQDGIRLRRDEGTVFCDENEVSSARLLDIRARCGIEVQVFVIALLVRVNYLIKAHCVVEAGFYVTGTVGRRAVVIAHAQTYRLCAALEIRTDGSCKNAELKIHRGFHTDDGSRAEHERTQVKRRTRAVWRHKRGICRNDLVYRLEKSLLGKDRYLHAAAGVCESCRV